MPSSNKKVVAKNATKNTVKSNKSSSKGKAPLKVATKKNMNTKATNAKPIAPKTAAKVTAKTPVAKKAAPVVVAKTKTSKVPPVASAQPLAKIANAKVQNKKDIPAKEAVRVKGSKKSADAGYDSSICREVACELSSTTGGYCRMHYIKNWKRIKRKEVILKEKKLNSYIEELISKYPDKYIEAIRQDLASEKDFSKVIADLEIDEGGLDDFGDVETESAEGILENIKRDFDDEGDVF
jgi:hypothetical protein